jgi:hypothetical protein
VDTWGTDDKEALERDGKDVLEVDHPIAHNRTWAEPGIVAEVVPS